MSRKSMTVAMVSLLVLFIFVALPIRGECQQKPIKWKIAFMYPRGTVFTQIYHGFSESVQKMSGGRLVFEELYADEGIGFTEQLPALRSGMIQMAMPYQALYGDVPTASIELGLPGSPRDFVKLRGLFHETKWTEFLREAYARHNAYWLGEYCQIPTYLLTKKQIQNLGDLKGMKLRGVSMYGKMLSRLGAAPVTMSYGEIYTSLATGLIEGAAGSNIIDYRDGRFQEQAKWLYPLDVSGCQTFPVLVNINEWKSLPEDLRQILEAANTQFNLDMRVKSTLWEEGALKDMMKAGLKWGPKPTEGDIVKWKEAGQGVWPEFEAKDELSKKMVAVLRDYMKEMGD